MSSPVTLVADDSPDPIAAVPPDGPQAVEAGAGLHTDTLADSVLLLLVLTVLQRLVGFLRSIFFCRWLSPEELGQWDLAWSFLVFAAPLAVLALPGTFGRYVERYRQRGQLRAFLARTTIVCMLLAVPAVCLVAAAPGWFSQMIFGTSEHAKVVLMLAGSLVAVLAYNFFTELSTALRNVRLVSGLQMLNSAAFAVLGLALLATWQCTAVSVVLAYGLACLVSVAVALAWLLRMWRTLPPDAQPLDARELWSTLAPFTGWLLLMGMLSNLFGIVDRCLMIHFLPGTPDEALIQVGQYHSSRVVPLLLVSIAIMLGTTLTPHLSHDWEAGRREAVSSRLRLFLKLLALGLTAASAAVLAGAPLLFALALQNKFSAGEAVLPWTLAFCVWSGVTMVAQTYLWCAEKTWLPSIALFTGLATNVVLGMLLLPRLGLLGAVLGTTVANCVAMLLILWFDWRWGFRIDPGLCIILSLPLSLCLGPWVAILMLAAVAWEAVRSKRIFNAEEKQQIVEAGRKYWNRLAGLVHRSSTRVISSP